MKRTETSFDPMDELDNVYDLVNEAVTKLSRIARLKDAGRINLGRVDNWRNHLMSIRNEIMAEVCDA